jgi:hypothetical protein
LADLAQKGLDLDEEEAALSHLVAIQLELKRREWSRNCWLWATECVYTKDEATQKKTPFPKDWLYVRDIFQVLDQEQMIVFPKSRRMFVSWAVATWVLHRIRFHDYYSIYWQSLQEAKAAYIVDERIKFMEDNLNPLFRIPYTAVKTKSGLVGKLIYNNSYVLAIPQGDDQIRSFTPSALICDEIEHQPEGPEAITAALSTVEKDSKIVLIGTSDGPGKPIASICDEVGFYNFPKYFGKSLVSVKGEKNGTDSS